MKATAIGLYLEQEKQQTKKERTRRLEEQLSCLRAGLAAPLGEGRTVSRRAPEMVEVETHEPAAALALRHPRLHPCWAGSVFAAHPEGQGWQQGKVRSRISARPHAHPSSLLCVSSPSRCSPRCLPAFLTGALAGLALPAAGFSPLPTPACVVKTKLFHRVFLHRGISCSPCDSRRSRGLKQLRCLRARSHGSWSHCCSSFICRAFQFSSCIFSIHFAAVACVGVRAAP